LDGYFSEECVVSKGLWPAQFPDMFSCNFYMWEALKQKVYRNYLQTLAELEVTIQAEIAIIQDKELMSVAVNCLKRAQQ
jgi:hypothetical protein